MPHQLTFLQQMTIYDSMRSAKSKRKHVLTHHVGKRTVLLFVRVNGREILLNLGA